MAITTLDGYIASAKQRIQYLRTASRTTIAAMPFTTFELAGNPGAGVLAGVNTANGVVPTGGTTGYPTINAFGGGATGYLARVEFANSVASRISIYDRLFVAGAYAFNASVALTAQPSFSARLPGTDYTGLELWAEMVTAATGNQAVTVTYTDSLGNPGHTTGAVGIGGAQTLGRMWQLPFAAGDVGIQKIESVTGTVATVGTFNVMVMRRLWTGRIVSATSGDTHDMLRTGLPVVYASSALYPVVYADSTSSGIFDLSLEIANA